MIINTNISALNSHRQLGANQNAMQSSMEKLSSGLRINRAGDDAAGLAISEKMRAQINGLDQASRNAQDGISLIQTAEGALDETHSILQRMRELAVQSANDTNTDADRDEIQKEVNQLTSEINRISDTTEFNTKKLLNGDLATAKIKDQSLIVNNNDSKVFTEVAIGEDAELTNNTYNVKITGVNVDEDGAIASYNVKVVDSKGVETLFEGDDAIDVGEDIELEDGAITISTASFTDASEANKLVGQELTFTTRAAVADTENKALSFQIGANSSQTINVGIGNMSASALNVEGVDLTTAQGAASAISVINQAIEDVSAQRSELGAFQNRLEHTISNLDNSSENLSAAESRIRDVDMAKEMMEMTKNNILSQASQSMLAQANQAPQSVLQLLG
ncbi:flagellin [Alkalicoccus daliensis]|uniref:Flagellin n=1 Tax=Alkalicoccus daliensis TaxID=745820 RepID=A0A1H0J014_9BACI|nr:flagellin [Alkalicoccus daliensis]SDO36769.1 flagellin [Alkalicoccus daliensis]